MGGRKIVGVGRSAPDFPGRDGTPLVAAGSCRPAIFLPGIFLPNRLGPGGTRVGDWDIFPSLSGWCRAPVV
jgi:hypothetical protein